MFKFYEMFELYDQLSAEEKQELKVTLFSIALGLAIGAVLVVGLMLYATGARL